MSTDIILRSHIDNNLYILPSSSELSKVEYKSLSVEPDAMALRAYLEQKDVDSFFDFAILDTPSTLGFLMVAALKSADQALIPVKLDAFTYSDLSIFLDVFEDTQRFLAMKDIQYNDTAKPNLLGIVPVAADMRLAESKYWKREYQLVYKDLFWGTNTINSNAPTSAALVLNQTIFMYDKSARNCNQYTDLARDW
jgi:cellulose biosynthesis protein BcsQ